MSGIALCENGFVPWIDFAQIAGMESASDIPVFSTHDIWQRYVVSPMAPTEFWRFPPDQFLISPLIEFAPAVVLPSAPHRRVVNEIVLVTHGEVRRSVDLNQVCLGPGDIHLALAGQIFSIDSIAPDTQGWYCHFSWEAVAAHFPVALPTHDQASLHAALPSGAIALSADTQAHVGQLFTRLFAAYNGQHDFALISSYLLALCQEIRQAAGKTAAHQNPSRAALLTEAFKHQLQGHRHDGPDLAAYAARLKVSPNHLNKAVKAATGRPASALLADMLVLEAKVLLRHSPGSIAEVAYALGFQDQAYFARFFRRHAGMAPGDYRRMD